VNLQYGCDFAKEYKKLRDRNFAIFVGVYISKISDVIHVFGNPLEGARVFKLADFNHARVFKLADFNLYMFIDIIS